MGMRFNSTSSPAEQVTADIASKFDTTLGFDESASAVADTLTTTLTSDQFGYLKSIGLCDSYWPSDIIQYLLEAVHVTTGLPWWATIAVTTLGCRLALFPLFMASSDAMARSQPIMNETKELRKEINLATAAGDTALRQIKTLQLQALNKKYGVKHSRMFLSPLAQVSYGFGSFFGIREMSNANVQGFADQGTLWFQDLLAPDPYLGLQVISACCYSLSFQLGGETAVNQFGPTMKKVFVVLPFVSILVTMNFSAAILVYFTVNGFFSILQGRLLRSPGFRKFAKLQPLMDPALLAAQNKGMAQNFTETWSEMKSNNDAKMKMNERAKKATAMQFARAKAGKVIIQKRK
ncbi:hypothetical protein CANARDRAFT_201470 [[Candida] arabinofermentans NRRL YB-2248]|uniref:Membrane insertase YidC/Oxa/ALB C-terminal domain-containing protein n=1 Tax=[Candida] arabinofermentans NRRL YB-2248 TaxID=983967 RepID=A0A1E4SXQ0_9ASCO|nr:hypothetical protein CANARDRAFT_201470 [[Candida] arabinofermentans NRRL YB-2248]